MLVQLVCNDRHIYSLQVRAQRVGVAMTALQSGVSLQLTRPQKVMCEMSRGMRKMDFCICENKDVDQLCRKCTAYQQLCFCYTGSTISYTYLQNFKLLAFFGDRPIPVELGWKPRRLGFL